MEAFEVRLELVAINTPNPATADLDGWERSRANERVNLRNAHVEVGSDVLQGQETGFKRGRALVRSHGPRITAGARRYVDWSTFTSICVQPIATRMQGS
jgi:hypothetical protein